MFTGSNKIVLVVKIVTSCMSMILKNYLYVDIKRSTVNVTKKLSASIDIQKLLTTLVRWEIKKPSRVPTTKGDSASLVILLTANSSTQWTEVRPSAKTTCWDFVH